MSEPSSAGIYVGPSHRVAGRFEIVPIHPTAIDQARPWLHEALTAALEHATLGRVDAQYLLDEAEAGRVLVLFCIERDTMQVYGVGAVEQFESISGRRVAHFTALSGQHLAQWLEDGLEVIESILIEQGIDSVTLLGRPAWRHTLAPHGWQRLAVLLGKDLTP